MDHQLARALEPAVAGTMVRFLGPVIPGIGRTRDQIAGFRNEWTDNATAALHTDHAVVVALGDSLSQGIGAESIRCSYVGLVAQQLRDTGARPFGIVNLSRSGAKTNDVLDVQLPALSAIDNKVVLGMCTVGSNDLLRSVRVGATKKRLSRLIEELPETIAIATLPDARSQLAKVVNRHIRSEATRCGRPLADIGAALTSWKGLMASDGFHPNGKGHCLWADTFLETLRAAGLVGNDLGRV
ncbi:MAG: SGNH/GDSL hydrolase family protein [Acidimicrobiales bacterium]